MTGGFSASVIRNNGITMVGLAGELDMATAPRLQALFKELHGPVVVDCARLSFLDSSGLSVFAAASGMNGSVTLRNLSPACRRVVDICGLGSLVRKCRMNVSSLRFCSSDNEA